MDNFLNSVTIKELITWAIAIIGYVLAFWQYRQKTKIEFRFKQYAEKRTLYEKYIVEFANINKADKATEQLLYEKEFTFKRAIANNPQKDKMLAQMRIELQNY